MPCWNHSFKRSFFYKLDVLLNMTCISRYLDSLNDSTVLSKILDWVFSQYLNPSSSNQELNNNYHNHDVCHVRVYSKAKKKSCLRWSFEMFKSPVIQKSSRWNRFCSLNEGVTLMVMCSVFMLSFSLSNLLFK